MITAILGATICLQSERRGVYVLAMLKGGGGGGIGTTSLEV